MGIIKRGPVLWFATRCTWNRFLKNNSFYNSTFLILNSIEKEQIWNCYHEMSGEGKSEADDYNLVEIVAEALFMWS